MIKLKNDEIREYLDIHLPYIRGAMQGHHVLTQLGPYEGDVRILNATFLGSLIAGRMILEFLGIGIDRSGQKLIRPRMRADSICIKDLNGDLVDLDALNREVERHDLLFDYIKMAHKAGGHTTIPKSRPWPDFHRMIKEIDELLEQQIKTVRSIPKD